VFRSRINNVYLGSKNLTKSQAFDSVAESLSSDGVGCFVHPKDPTGKEKKCGVVYKVQCKDCEEDYIGGTARPFGIRLKEHDNITRASTTAVGDHLRDTVHTLDFSSSLIIARENDTFKRRIRETIEIHCQTPTMNRDNGYELPPIYGDVLSRGFHHPRSRGKASNTIT